jgi:hypothetical protein
VALVGFHRQASGGDKSKDKYTLQAGCFIYIGKHRRKMHLWE